MSFCTSLRILGGCSRTLHAPGTYARISLARSPRVSLQTTCLSRSPRNIFTTIRCLSSSLSRPISNDAPSVSQSFSSESIPSLTSGTENPPLSPPSVSNWLLGSAALVFSIVVVGGITRLTESGLSIVEWRPVSGVLPPLSEAAWEVEFEKYKTSPEFKITNYRISLSEFKRIYYWEYAHRVLGRAIGLAFVFPLAYYAIRRRLSPRLAPILGTLAVLIGAQGFLGWYMVKSGLDESIITTPNSVPRVSQYRLAAHLSMAILLFAGMLGCGLQTRMDWNWATKGVWNGLKDFGGNRAVPWENMMKTAAVRRFRVAVALLMGLVFLTACSGAFVAGLDAGLVYNEFPTMGGGLAPPLVDLMNPSYAKRADGADMWWRNIFENPATVQFDHRLLAMTTYGSTIALYLSTWRPSLRAALPLTVRRLALAAFGLANVQVLLGISTLLYLVPVPLAAAHQAGSIALLSSLVALLISVRRPSMTARVWRNSVARKTSPLPIR